MNSFNGGIQLSGIDSLNSALKQVPAKSVHIVMTGMKKGAMNVLADAYDNLKRNSSVVTGLLRQSGKTQEIDNSTLDVGFFNTKKSGGYAWYVEYGRRAGRMPPPDELIQWSRKKFGLTAKAARAMGFAMAMKIAKRGTRPHPFFTPALEKNRKALLDVIQNSLGNQI